MRPFINLAEIGGHAICLIGLGEMDVSVQFLPHANHQPYASFGFPIYRAFHSNRNVISHTLTRAILHLPRQPGDIWGFSFLMFPLNIFIFLHLGL